MMMCWWLSSSLLWLWFRANDLTLCHWVEQNQKSWLYCGTWNGESNYQTSWRLESRAPLLINHENNFIIILAVIHTWQCDLGDLIGRPNWQVSRKPVWKQTLYWHRHSPSCIHSFILFEINWHSVFFFNLLRFGFWCSLPGQWLPLFKNKLYIINHHCVHLSLLFAASFLKTPSDPPPFPQVWSFFQKDNYNVMFVGNFMATIGHVYPF